jgi:cytochrome P450
VPPGILLFEDPPPHDLHRRLLSRVFTPRRMLAVESLVRGFCVRELDPLIGAGGFDFIADLGAMMPMRTIGYLLGIPEEDQANIRDRNGASPIIPPMT